MNRLFQAVLIGARAPTVNRSLSHTSQRAPRWQSPTLATCELVRSLAAVNCSTTRIRFPTSRATDSPSGSGSRRTKSSRTSCRVGVATKFSPAGRDSALRQSHAAGALSRVGDHGLEKVLRELLQCVANRHARLQQSDGQGLWTRALTLSRCRVRRRYPHQRAAPQSHDRALWCRAARTAVRSPTAAGSASANHASALLPPAAGGSGRGRRGDLNR